MERLPSASRLIAASILILAACAPAVTIHFDHDTDFSRYRTYAWREGHPAANPLIDQRIVAAIDEQLAAKSYQKTDTNPDLLVTYHAALTEQLSPGTASPGYGPAWGPGYGWYGRGGGTGPAGTSPATLTVGTLTVEISDAATTRMLWHGSAEDTVGQDGDKTAATIKKHVAALFERFPPR